MEAITILIQQSGVCNGLLNMQDIAVLHCVSNDIHIVIDTYISNIEQNNLSIVEATAQEFGIPCKNINHVVNIKLFLRQLLIVRRLYGNEEKGSKLRHALDDFTKNVVGSMWTEPFNPMSKNNQTDTVHFLLQCTQKNCLQQNIIVIYILMYFLSRLFNSKKKDIHDKNNSIFAYTNFRNIVVSKSIELTTTLREEVTGYPFMFIDRTIRKIGEVKRKTLSIS